MNKKISLLIFGVWFLSVSCNQNADIPSYDKEFLRPMIKKRNIADRENELSAHTLEASSVIQFDAKILDAKVIEQAKLLGNDPKKHLMPVRTNADGTEVFRQIGMHVIIAPDGEKRLLPDEI